MKAKRANHTNELGITWLTAKFSRLPELTLTLM
jgi:hypothetical protein